MSNDPRTLLDDLTDKDATGPVFFIASMPWSTPREGEPAPIRHIVVKHTSPTLAEYVTLDQLDRHVSMGYNSLFVGQRSALIEAGRETASWPIDDTGWGWSGSREPNRFVAFRRHPKPHYGWGGASDCALVAMGDFEDVRSAAIAASRDEPDVAVVIARECFFEAHWH